MQLLNAMRIFVINASQMQSAAFANSCFAVMVMNVGSKLIPAPAATSPFALTAYPTLNATCVLFNGVKDARTRANAFGVNLFIAGIAKENEGINCPILSAMDVSERLLLGWWERTSS